MTGAPVPPPHLPQLLQACTQGCTGRTYKIFLALFLVHVLVLRWHLQGALRTGAEGQLQQCLGGDAASSFCRESGKSRPTFKVLLWKAGSNPLSHEKYAFWQLQSGTKGIEMTSVASGQWLQSKECAARASPPGDSTAAGSCPGQPRREDIPWGHMRGQEGHRPPSWSMTGRTEPIALKSVNVWDTIYNVSTCNPWASFKLAFSI